MSDEVAKCRNKLYEQFFEIRDDMQNLLSRNHPNKRAIKHLLSKNLAFDQVSDKTLSQGFNEYTEAIGKITSKEEWSKRLHSDFGSQSSVFLRYLKRFDEVSFDFYSLYEKELKSICLKLISKYKIKRLLERDSGLSIYGNDKQSDRIREKLYEKKVMGLAHDAMRLNLISTLFEEDISDCTDLFQYTKGGINRYKFSDVIQSSGIWDKEETKKINDAIEANSSGHPDIDDDVPIKTAIYESSLSKKEYKTKIKMRQYSASGNEKGNHQDWLLTGVEREVELDMTPAEFNLNTLALKLCLAKLTNRQSELIQNLYMYYSDFSDAAVAERMGVKPQYVCNNKNKLLNLLEKCIDKHVRKSMDKGNKL